MNRFKANEKSEACRNSEKVFERKSFYLYVNYPDRLVLSLPFKKSYTSKIIKIKIKDHM